MKTVTPISAIIATRNREGSLSRALESLLSQDFLPQDLVVIDGSNDDATKAIVEKFAGQVGPSVMVRHIRADVVGAAAQRNQGVSFSTQNAIWFFDDDVVFEPNCLERLWSALQSDPQLGGVNAMITNQTYGTPGAVSRFMYRLMNGKRESSYAGRIIGPAINLLPEDRDVLPEVVPVEWLNTTCTMYRREALPDPPFLTQFTGYSLMEDLALSLEVGKRWKLANVRTARILHDSQSADYKSDESSRSCMELANRHFIMTQIMDKRGFSDYARLALWELFSLASSAADKRGRRALPYILRGKWRALRQIVSGRGSEEGRAEG
jgi:glycosyltransferase involved in cell wall biosynthesis